MGKRGFTLIELLVVIAIIAIIASIIMVVINPPELLKRSRDSNRLSDLNNLTTAINEVISDGAIKGIPRDQILCNPPTYSAPCQGNSTDVGANAKDGTGWIKANFNNYSTINIPTLPLDPINKFPYYYAYASDGNSFEIATRFESQKYQSMMNTSTNTYNSGTSTSLVSSTQYPASSSPLAQGLISYWKFDEGVGATVSDSAGTNGGSWTGTLGNQWGVGKINAGGNFNGSDNYVDTKHIGLIDNATALSIAFWYRRNAPGNYATLGQGDDGNHTIAVEVYNDGLDYFDLGTYGNYVSFPSNDNSWHYIVFTFDSSQSGSSNQVKGYLDGVQQNLSFHGTVPVSLPATSNDFVIGRLPTAGSEWANGQTDEVGIWNRALSQAEVTQLYNSGVGKQYPF